jgi:hypothetical protein
MSAPTAEPQVGIVRVTVGLCVLAGIVWSLASLRAGPVDGRALLASNFEERALPFGLELESALRLSDERELVVLANPHAAPEAERAEPPPPPAEGADPRPPFDATKVPLGRSGEPPRRVELVFRPKGSGLAGVRAEFERGDWSDLRSIGHEGGVAAIDFQILAWQGYDAICIHERRFEPGGSFVDSMRVNLSTPGRPCVLRAIWSRGMPGSLERLRELLEALVPVPPAPPAAGN